MEKPDNSLKFTEESSRIIHGLEDIELDELGQISRTIQCHSCLQHIPEGLTFCSCAFVFDWTKKQKKRIKARFQALIVFCHFARVNRSTGKKHGETQ